MRKLLLFLTLITLTFSVASADNVSWSYRLVGDNTADPSLEITAKIEKGFHLYAFDNPPMGSNPLVMNFDL